MMDRRNTALYLAVLSTVALAACGDSTGPLDSPESDTVSITLTAVSIPAGSRAP